MKSLRAAFVGLMLAVVAGAYAVSGGGFPSRPTFQALNVTGGSALSCNTGGTNTIACAKSTNAGVWAAVAAGPSLGFQTQAGSTGSDISFRACNAALTACWFAIDGAGNITSPQAPASTPWPLQTSGTFTSTLSTGCTTTPTATVSWVKTGSLVTVWWPANSWSCTSNTTTKTTDTSVPAAERPTTTKCLGIISGEDNTTNAIMTAQITSAGALNFGKALVGTGASQCNGFDATNAGTFAMDSGSFTYTLQ